tara:strand:+ start:6493 stop:6825 length:333 start_codon:yes stop_codon:yes gene_type:complete
MLITPSLSRPSPFLVMSIPQDTSHGSLKDTPYDCTHQLSNESNFSFIRAFKYFFSSQNNHTTLHIGDDVEELAATKTPNMTMWLESASESQLEGFLRYQSVNNNHSVDKN